MMRKIISEIDAELYSNAKYKAATGATINVPHKQALHQYAQ